MPTISESTDEGMRAGKAASVLDYWSRGMLGDATLVASLRILRYEPEEIRLMMEKEKQRCRRHGCHVLKRVNGNHRCGQCGELI